MKAALLRNGNVTSVHDWTLVLMPVIHRYCDLDIAKLFRSDAAFAIPKLNEFLETKDFTYAIHLSANTVLYHHLEYEATS